MMMHMRIKMPWQSLRNIQVPGRFMHAMAATENALAVPEVKKKMKHKIPQKRYDTVRHLVISLHSAFYLKLLFLVYIQSVQVA